MIVAFSFKIFLMFLVIVLTLGRYYLFQEKKIYLYCILKKAKWRNTTLIQRRDLYIMQNTLTGNTRVRLFFISSALEIFQLTFHLH